MLETRNRRCLLPLLLLLLLRLMSLRLLLIGLSIANCACALWVYLPAHPPIAPTSPIGTGTGRCHHHQQHCRRWRFWGETVTARLGIVAENYYSGYYSQSITLPQRHSHTHTYMHTQTNTHKYINKGTVRQRATFWQAQLSIHVLHIMTIIMAATIMNAWRLITPSRR